MNMPMNGGTQAPMKVRYGCFEGKIGAQFPHKLEQALQLPSGRRLAIGQTIHLTLEDLSRCPEFEPHVKWRCHHPECAGVRFGTKRELIASHKSNRELEKLEEVHLYFAIAYCPATPGKEAKLGKSGEIIEDAVPAKLASVKLLSDEE